MTGRARRHPAAPRDGVAGECQGGEGQAAEGQAGEGQEGTAKGARS